MPRKTKKEKEFADYRRKTAKKQSLLTTSIKIGDKKDVAYTQHLLEYAHSSLPNSQGKGTEQAEIYNYSHVFGDIAKMVIFTFLAIGSQVVLYFLLQS